MKNITICFLGALLGIGLLLAIFFSIDKFLVLIHGSPDYSWWLVAPCFIVIMLSLHGFCSLIDIFKFNRIVKNQSQKGPQSGFLERYVDLSGSTVTGKIIFNDKSEFICHEWAYKYILSKCRSLNSGFQQLPNNTICEI